MTASYTYALTTGTIAIDTTDLLSDVEGEWQSAFGATLNVDASTPQGTMIAAETTARTSVMKNNADVGNMMNPNLAYGTWLDAVCAFLGIGRGTNQSTIAQGVTITGNATTTIAAGSRVQTSNGDVFTLQTTVTIPSGGTTTGTFQSQAYGRIPFPIGTLTILDGTIGWGSAVCTVSSTITLGSTQLTDPQLKNQRNKQLSVQGTASAAAVYANLLNVPNVTSALVVENNTGSAGTVNGITFTKNTALWACVAGSPTSSAVAAAMYAARNSGCPWDYGATGMGNPVKAPNGVQVTDPATGLPYDVLYTTPILYDTYIQITVQQNSAQAPGSEAVQNAIMSFANGQQVGDPGFVIGAEVSAFDIAGTVLNQYPGLKVPSCMIACVPAGSAPPSYPSGYSYVWTPIAYQQAQLAIGNIIVTLE